MSVVAGNRGHGYLLSQAVDIGVSPPRNMVDAITKYESQILQARDGGRRYFPGPGQVLLYLVFYFISP